jgi:hypothetical protein
MKLLYLIQDEWFPVYLCDEHKPKYYKTKKVFLTSKEVSFVNKAFKDFSKAQDLLETKFAEGSK